MTRLVTYPEEDLKIKIILVGDSGVGKSNIRSRFCRNKFDPFSYRTVGVEYATRSFLAAIDNTQQKFTACLWDIVGERTNP